MSKNEEEAPKTVGTTVKKVVLGVTKKIVGFLKNSPDEGSSKAKVKKSSKKAKGKKSKTIKVIRKSKKSSDKPCKTKKTGEKSTKSSTKVKKVRSAVTDGGVGDATKKSVKKSSKKNKVDKKDK